MKIFKSLVKNESGSAVTENIGWIVGFVMVMFTVIGIFALSMGNALQTQGKTILTKTYDTWCATNTTGTPVWDGKDVLAGAMPKCLAARPA